MKNICNQYSWKEVFLYSLLVLFCFLGFGHSILQTFRLISLDYIGFIFMFVAAAIILLIEVLFNTWNLIKIIKDSKTETKPTETTELNNL